MKKNCTPNLKLTFAQGKTSLSGQLADPTGAPLPNHHGDIHAHWQETAARKGFSITARILDRYHLALRCHACGHVHPSRIYTLMNAQPQCPACCWRGWRRKPRRPASPIWIAIPTIAITAATARPAAM